MKKSFWSPTSILIDPLRGQQSCKNNWNRSRAAPSHPVSRFGCAWSRVKMQGSWFLLFLVRFRCSWERFGAPLGWVFHLLGWSWERLGFFLGLFSSSWGPSWPPRRPPRGLRGPLGSSPAAPECDFDLLTWPSELLRRPFTSSRRFGRRFGDLF